MSPTITAEIMRSRQYEIATAVQHAHRSGLLDLGRDTESVVRPIRRRRRLAVASALGALLGAR